MSEEIGQTVETVGLSEFKSFIVNISTCLFDADEKHFSDSLESSQNSELINKFINEPQQPVLFVQKLVSDIDGETKATYMVSNNAEYLDDKTSTIAFIKKAESSAIEKDRSISSQIQVINLGDGSVFENVYSLIRNSIAPYFKEFIKKTHSKISKSSKKDSNVGISLVNQKLYELEYTLYQCKQNIQIPHVILQYHSEILNASRICNQEGRALNTDELGDNVNKTEFLNALQAGVNKWILDISKVTRLERIETFPGNTPLSQELRFWMELENELNNIENQLSSPEAICTMNILKQAKRFHATASFDTDTIGLKKTMTKVLSYKPLIKDFPLNELLSAEDIPTLSKALVAIFEHMKKTKAANYPLVRYLRLAEAIAREICSKVREIFNSKQILQLNFSDFDILTTDARSLFTTWDDEFIKFRELLRELGRKRRQGEEDIPLVINVEIKAYQDRIINLQKFRRQHEEFRRVIEKVIQPEIDYNMLEEVDSIYMSIQKYDPLSLTPEGVESWQKGVDIYNEKISNIESKIKDMFREQLQVASEKSSNEMFRVFSKFNSLFFRTKIRSAGNEYRPQLLQRVKEDIQTLHERFKNTYKNSEDYPISEIRDIPPVSGLIIWVRQIQNQLHNYKRRIEDVLGKKWENDEEGRNLKEEIDMFDKKLDPESIYEDFVQSIASENFEAIGEILTVNKKGNQLMLDVRLNPKIFTVFREIKFLRSLGFRPTKSIIYISTISQSIYPHAVNIKETIDTYHRTSKLIKPEISLLLEKYRKDVQTLISEGFKIKWNDQEKLPQYVSKFSQAVTLCNIKAEDVLSRYEIIENCLENMKHCEFTHENLINSANEIQKVVDYFNLAEYSHLRAWTKELGGKIESILSDRLKESIEAWTNAIDIHKKADDDIQQTRKLQSRKSTLRLRGPTTKDTTAKVEKVVTDNKYKPSIKTVTHEIIIKNQVMQVSPTLEYTRASLIGQFNDWISIIINIPKLQSSRYDIRQSRAFDSKIENHRSLLSKLPLGTLTSAYKAIEGVIQEARNYVSEWLQYQSLWDMEPSLIYSRLSDDVEVWKQLLQEIRRSRTTFDTSDTKKEIGPITINYGKVQINVNNKYDYWHKDILSNFGIKLGGQMRAFHKTISENRLELESISVETGSTIECIAFTVKIQEIKKNLGKWEQNLASYKSGQQLLQRQRHQFPNDWLDYDVIEGEWQQFNEILQRKTNELNEEIPLLQKKIIAESSAIDDKIKALYDDWNKDKPIGGSNPNAALETLNLFFGRTTRLQEELDRITQARIVLDLDTQQDDRLVILKEEITDIKNVWEALSNTWKEIELLKETPWNSVVPSKIGLALDDLLEKLRFLPNKIRQYEDYNRIHDLLTQYRNGNSILIDLRSEALRDRHWRMLRKRLNVKWNFSELTLGDIWEANLMKNEHSFRDIINQAQGELSLEQFLKDIKEFWQTYQLDMVNYQKKTMLIRGWDDLFGKINDHLNNINVMKNSPYFKEFESDAAIWEDKINKIQMIFDTWIDVQRRWVYLEGIFSGSSDIRNLLPRESARFDSINAEFLSLMSRAAKTVLVLDIVNFEGTDKTLERLSDLLSKVQKALGEYLEKQRAAFPRFYFIGDEDLLDIIGNAKDIPKIQKHFKKMFAGLSSLLLQDNYTTIIGMGSSEGESVHFINPIDITKHPRIDSWLKALETEMKFTLASLMNEAITNLESYSSNISSEQYIPQYLEWAQKYPAQLVILGAQIIWSQKTDEALASSGSIEENLASILTSNNALIRALADKILTDIESITRTKFEQLINELVHQRDVVRRLIDSRVNSAQSFEWLSEMRFYWNHKEENLLKKLAIRMANASFDYGYEYLGVSERLVQTPLTDRCYLTLTQAINTRMGGSPYGPAGTGKTETVKALGTQLGRLVLVFCCDEGFDFQAMCRIFVGLCMCGAWGCFDEFNRLEERILSAVSQQIQIIQTALRDRKSEVEVSDGGKAGSTRKVLLDEEMAIFVTMNPGYAGRSNLPDNLKQLFRGIAMIKPDRELIAEVMLYSQGYKTAERLSSKIVPLFELCEEQLSNQSHYDFGLRALKSVLVSAGNLKRQLNKTKDSSEIEDENIWEQNILIQSICENIIPKLISEDISLFHSLLSDVFPGSSAYRIGEEALREQIIKIADKHHLIAPEQWVEKILQLNQVQILRHGVMLVGPAGSGKTTAWTVLLESLEKLTGIKSKSYVLDPKAVTKDNLFGTLDSTTREWTDGLFTHLLRKIIDNLRGESEKRHWIIFDGDVDPEWVENLNALLDDNKILTLPNGERLALPNNVRIIFEVKDLKYATLATVSRCGMIWFNEDTVTNDMIFQNYLKKLERIPLDEQEKALQQSTNVELPGMKLQAECAVILKQHLQSGGILDEMVDYCERKWHIMDYTRLRVLNSTFSLINKSILNVLEYMNKNGTSYPQTQIDKYITNRLLFSIMWGFGGSMNLQERELLSKHLLTYDVQNATIPSNSDIPLLDYYVNIDDGEWHLWNEKVPYRDIETHEAASPDLVIPTVDTVRHVEVVKAWLSEHRPLILCGPPGSGKTMTLEDTLRSLPDYELVSLNFSSATTPELIMKTFEHHCEYKKTTSGMTLRPTQVGKWIVVFCDEINLPAEDKYGTQRVITFIRQMIEKGGFWKTKDHVWVTLERIQFLGACNPPTDPGRVPLTTRFLNHAPILYVDFPSKSSLLQIYGTFSRAILKLVPDLRSYDKDLTNAIVEFYLESQKRFTPDIQAHYIYSPRELTRWIRALREAIVQWEGEGTLEDLVRIWAHEGLRLFQDRLVTHEERQWTDEKINEVALTHFPTVDSSVALARPILFSNWLSKEYRSVDRDELRDYVKARLRIFYEEELDVPLVLFNEVLDHILRIDRVLKQPQGHALLIGVSGGGKTVLSRFVAWLNGFSVFTIKVNNKYSAEDFDHDLRHVMKRASVNEEKICFIFDESNVLESSFLERMNTLLASGEVPGLFEGEEYTGLMHQLKETVSKKGLIIDNESELFSWFTQQVRKNLHVVFTMNPSSQDFHNRAATSPALFNRCVLDWFGEWSDEALFQVGEEFTNKIDLDTAPHENEDDDLSHRQCVVNTLVYVHNTIHEANKVLVKQQGRQNYVTPRHYLDFINHFAKLINEKRGELEEQQLHMNVGLNKIRETEAQVKELQDSLAIKNQELEKKQEEANIKLQIMIEDQQKAEMKQKEVKVIQDQVAKQNVDIEEQRKIATADLEKAEPALIEAQKAVKGIKKKHLDEVKALGRPPELVQRALEAVFILLKGKKLDWTTIRKSIVEQSFIPSIVEFQSENITAKQREILFKEYISDSKFNFESVDRASKACGPLVKWTIAQLEYSEILDKVEPLRIKVAQLEKDSAELVAKGQELSQQLQELEESIAKYKAEYASLISQSESIKAEMAVVQNKVDRSIRLIQDLSNERNRWEQESLSFEEQMSTVIGDSLLASAFLAYAGFFDQHYRSNLMSKWQFKLESYRIKFKNQLSIIEYLSHPDDRLKWQANALPVDELCTENAIMLHRFNRYPLVIDPSGQATEFLMNYYHDRKIRKTSFLDSAFMKNLESALRFGTPLLVEDVESIDPVLNPVLNKEIKKTGGRVLIRLGDNDIDFSPSFVIFLSTRDPTAHFTPDLCSRVTFVNFTVTPKSLQSQCLHNVLKTEQPEIHEKRKQLMKLQGEYRVKLRKLEKLLLDALNESKTNILDDNKVLSTLETIKKESAEVHTQVEETDKIMDDMKAVSAFYFPLALVSSYIYFTMEQMNQVHFLYQFSLNYFLDIFYSILNENPKLENVTDQKERMDILMNELFNVTYSRIRRSLLHSDRLAFALRLAQIKLYNSQDELKEAEFDFLVKGTSRVVVNLNPHDVLDELFDVQQRQSLVELKEIDGFGNIENQILSSVSEWKTFMRDPNAENKIPKGYFGLASTPVLDKFRDMIIIKVFRPDRLLSSASYFIESVFGQQFLKLEDDDFTAVVEKESKCNTPLILCSTPGYDASTKVDDLVVNLKPKVYKPIALGSREGFSEAEKTINDLSRTGGWVHLKNIHLAPQWLTQLEKKLHGLSFHQGFRLFMSSEIHPLLPPNLLRMSNVFVFEPPPGIKANLLQSLSEIPSSRIDQKPNERARIYFLLCWFHAILQERLRYTPFGWTKPFEFNNTDKKNSMDTIDFWIDSVAKNRTNIDPETIPWKSIRNLLGQTIYGGRIDNKYDQRLIDSFLEKIFTPRSFDHQFKLIETPRYGRENLTIISPDGSSRQIFMKWIDEIPNIESPSWLGLPDNAELLILKNEAQLTLQKLLKMQTIDDSSDDSSLDIEEDDENEGGNVASWMKSLESSCMKWIGLLPEDLSPMKKTASSDKNPIFRFFEREISLGIELLSTLKRDLNLLIEVCKGRFKQTNYIRSLISKLMRGIVPSQWKRYTISESKTLNQWLLDFGDRINQLRTIESQLEEKEPLSIWLGGLFNPEAFITAIKQKSARAHEWSLENLELYVDVIESEEDLKKAKESDVGNNFIIENLILHGAQWKNNALQIGQDMSILIPKVRFQFKPKEEGRSPDNENKISIPLYLNDTRRDFLIEVDLEGNKDIEEYVWYQRGVALSATM